MPVRAASCALVCLALLLLQATSLCAPTWAQEAPAALPHQELSREALESLRVLRERIATVDDLSARGRINEDLARAEREHYMGQVARVTSEVQTPAELVALCERHRDEASSLSRLWGWFSFLRLIWLTVGLLLVTALWWLASLYLVPLVKRLPPAVIEVALYLVCGAAIVAPRLWWSGGGVLALAFAGCLGLLPLAAWTQHLHFDWKGPNAVRFYALAFGVVWGATALLHSSTLIATLSLISLSLLSGSVIVPILGAAVFLTERFVPAIMLVALTLLAGYAGLEITGHRVPHLEEALEVFKPGSLWIGTLVYFTGFLVISSRRYEAGWLRFAVNQGVAIGSGVLGLYVGSVFEIDTIRESSGSFLAFYLGSKLLDLPWKKDLWAWGCLLLALGLWGAATFMEGHPQYFLGF